VANRVFVNKETPAPPYTDARPELRLLLI